MDDLFFMTSLFVMLHFVLSAAFIRDKLIKILQVGGFRVFYSVIVGIFFLLMVEAYQQALYEPIWSLPLILQPIAPILMLPACFFVFCAVTTRNPTMVYGETVLEKAIPPKSLAIGVFSITRHPMLIGTSLWAVAHLIVNGDRATIIVAVGILLLSVGGMFHIDHKRRQVSGWGTYVLTTSIIPFVAIFENRNQIDFKGIGWWRIGGTFSLYGLLFIFHQDLAGVSLINLIH